MAHYPGVPRTSRAPREAALAGFTGPSGSRFDGTSMSSSPAPITDIDPEVILRNLPPWIVILHNDDHNSMEHVVQSLLKSVPPLTVEGAVDVMMTAHNQGRAAVTTCPKETAELYRERLEHCGLTSTIEAG